jgi:hypothetical protein
MSVRDAIGDAMAVERKGRWSEGCVRGVSYRVAAAAPALSAGRAARESIMARETN